MLKKCSAPMTADKSDSEAITQRSKMHGNEAKDVQWETVDGGQRIPPFVDGCRSGQDVLGELRKLEKIVFRASEESPTFNRESRTWSKVKLQRSVKDRSFLGGGLTMENKSYSSIRHSGRK